jgi:hypothetical protein
MLDKILGDHVPKKTRSLAMRILECMACSHRVLKTHEILDLIAFRPGCTTLDNKTKIRKEVLDLCQPLIEEGPSNTVNFVHYSARMYGPYNFFNRFQTDISQIYSRWTLPWDNAPRFQRECYVDYHFLVCCISEHKQSPSS